MTGVEGDAGASPGLAPDAAPRDFITFEYCMLDGVNDTPEHAKQLVELVRDTISCKFNLIPFNPFPESGLKRSPRERITAFAHVLQDAGVVTTVRKTRGDDIDAACGQLAGEVQDRTRVKQRLSTRSPIRIHRTGATAQTAAAMQKKQETKA